MWDDEADRYKGIIVKLFKKGRMTSCDSWRGITLQTVGSKVLCQVILSRIQTQVDLILKNEQLNFRPNRFCWDLIFSLRVLLEDQTNGKCRLF